MAHRGCARDVLPDGLLSELSPGAGASVANRSGRSARLAVRVVALDLGEGAKTRPPPIAPGILARVGTAMKRRELVQCSRLCITKARRSTKVTKVFDHY